MQKERNIGEILIVKSVAATADMEGANVDGFLSTLAVGEPVVVNAAGTVIDATATLPAKFKIGVKLTSGVIQWTDLIDANSIKSINTNRYVAAAAPVDYIGYNGTSGSIEVINNNLYYVRMYIKPMDKFGFVQQKVQFGVYQSDANATQAEIAHGISENLAFNLSREPEKLRTGKDVVTVELVNSGTSTATSGGVVGVVKGSKYVQILGTGADAGKYNGDAASITAGDYIRFGHATTKTYPVYKVESVVSGGGAATMVVKLSTAYRGESNSAIAAASVGVIPAADVANFGIKLTGNIPEFEVTKFHFQVPFYDVTLEDFGSTLYTRATNPTLGNGDWREISQIEQQFLGNEGRIYRVSPFEPAYRSETVSNGTYATVVIEHVDTMTGNLGNIETSLKQTYLACAKGNGGAYSDANTGVGTILNAYITAKGIPSNGVTIATEINA